MQHATTQRCDGSCETQMGCACWAASRKLTEADLDARRAEREAAAIAWRLRYMGPPPLPDATLAAMLKDGTLSGPYRRVQPATLTLRQRLERFVRRHLIDWETPRP